MGRSGEISDYSIATDRRSDISRSGEAEISVGRLAGSWTVRIRERGSLRFIGCFDEKHSAERFATLLASDAPPVGKEV